MEGRGILTQWDSKWGPSFTVRELESVLREPERSKGRKGYGGRQGEAWD